MINFNEQLKQAKNIHGNYVKNLEQKQKSKRITFLARIRSDLYCKLKKEIIEGNCGEKTVSKLLDKIIEDFFKV